MRTITPSGLSWPGGVLSLVPPSCPVRATRAGSADSVLTGQVAKPFDASRRRGPGRLSGIEAVGASKGGPPSPPSSSASRSTASRELLGQAAIGGLPRGLGGDHVQAGQRLLDPGDLDGPHLGPALAQDELQRGRASDS